MTSYQCQGNKEKHMQKSERYLHKRMSSKKIGEPTPKSKYFNGFNGKQPLQIYSVPKVTVHYFGV